MKLYKNNAAKDPDILPRRQFTDIVGNNAGNLPPLEESISLPPKPNRGSYDYGNY